VCKRLKAPSAEGAFDATGVIMLTGIGENLNEMTSPLFAADTWLNKPFDFADLEAKIREILDKYAEKRALAAAASAHEPAAAPAEKKAAAKKAPAKKASKKKAAKPAAKKAAAKKAATKKPAAKKAATKKPAAKKSAAKKTAKKKAARAK
jgi:DNA-binding response OmpR family regulator